MTGERRDVFGLVDAVVSAFVQRLTPPATQSDYLLLTHGKAVDMPTLPEPRVKDQMTRAIEVTSGQFRMSESFTFGDLVRFVEVAREQGAITGDVVRLRRGIGVSTEADSYQLSLIRSITEDVNMIGAGRAAESMVSLAHKTGLAVDLTEVDEGACVTTYLPKPEPISMCPAVHPIEDVRCDGPAGHAPTDQHGAVRNGETILWTDDDPFGRIPNVDPAHPPRQPQDTNAQPEVKQPGTRPGSGTATITDRTTPISADDNPHGF